MVEIKKNVEEFNSNVIDNGGYLYTTHAKLSSVLSNKRISDEVNGLIGQNIASVIDAGCGDGAYTFEIAQNKPGLKVIGFDPAKEAIAIAQKKYSNIQFYVGNILDLNTFNGQKSDVAVIRGVLHHLSDPELAIKNSIELSSEIIIVEPNGNNPILKVIEKLSPYHRLHEEQSFSSGQLQLWCERQGLYIKSLNYIGFVPFFFPAFLTHIIYFFQPFFEKIFILKKYFGAQIVIYAIKK